MEQNRLTRSLGVSAAPPVPVHFPGENGGRSFAEMAQRDLDAALQLLADRAQYITGASGAAIALRRDGQNDMLCRASCGENAPELGALLSTEFGLSGESVRTRQLLRCDDAERDARVNQAVCRELGIASVLVMPVVNDDQVLGVFELFSGKVNAFGERDLSAVQRLSQMVETAVRLAQVAASLPRQLALREKAAAPSMPEVMEGQFLSDLVVDESAEQAEPPAVGPTTAAPAAPAPAMKKVMFWSAASHPEAESVSQAEPSVVPPVLRGLRKCEACGFPVSAGRVLCVECEEKKWRGQMKPQGAARKVERPVVSTPEKSAGLAAAAAPARAKAAVMTPVPSTKLPGPAKVESGTASPGAPAAKAPVPSPEVVFTGSLGPSQSWLSANKYVVVVLVLIGAAAAGFFLFR